MEVGLYLTNQQPLGRDMTEALKEQLEMVAFVRDHGWNSIFTGHHYLADLSSQLQPIPFLARLAAETGNMRLGVGILLLTLLNPVAVAEDVASLDVITGGKVILGVGLGYRDTEFEACREAMIGAQEKPRLAVLRVPSRLEHGDRRRPGIGCASRVCV